MAPTCVQRMRERPHREGLRIVRPGLGQTDFRERAAGNTRVPLPSRTHIVHDTCVTHVCLSHTHSQLQLTGVHCSTFTHTQAHTCVTCERACVSRAGGYGALRGRKRRRFDVHL